MAEKPNTYHKIKNCTLYWAYLEAPSPKSNKHQVNCCNLSKDDQKTLKALGLTVNDGKEKGHAEYGMFVVAKATRPVLVVDAKKNTMKNTGSIGNGTIANVNINAYSYPDHGNGAGVACGLQAVQIIDLVEYTPGGGFDIEEGHEEPQEQTVFD
tara:strand:- start:1927 stop:2388 length:462 start_codon:yes stop_codon:yes gene_type:complete